MNKTSVSILLLLSMSFLSTYAVAGEWKPFETKDEARQRHSAENYDTYRNNHDQAPLGGYHDTLGDPAPKGTEMPGLYQPQEHNFGGGLDDYTSGQDKDLFHR